MTIAPGWGGEPELRNIIEMQKSQIKGLITERDELREAINSLIFQWDKEGDFSDNPHDHESDRVSGRTYKECAEQLKSALTKLQEASVDAEEREDG